MDWYAIVPSLLVGGFVGWVAGHVAGHGETQRKMEQQERKMHALLKHFYWGQVARLNDSERILSAIANPDEAQFILREMRDNHRSELDEREDDQDGFFAEMFR